MDRPIVLHTHEVRAILDGRQTQLRRVLKPQPREDIGIWLAENSPPHAPGDRLWARETFAGEAKDLSRKAIYRADPGNYDIARWKPPIHMPRWASRITLIVESVKVERVQELTLRDVYAEGIFTPIDTTIGPAERACADRAAFRDLWTSLNAKHPWDANPWVAATTFRPVMANIDHMDEAALNREQGEG